ncbi:MAG: hypothetical protein HZB72_09005 [Burkholderiales bacterium]|nr:hypothetical protein [Burkholderiales bacterium]
MTAAPDLYARCSVCDQRIKHGLLMCWQHWQLVPQPMRDQVGETLRRYRGAGRRVTGALLRTLWARYDQACKAATAHVESALQRNEDLPAREPAQPTEGVLR